MNGADLTLAHALARPATLGAGRLICLDGPSGAGKTSLARAIADLSTATLVHLDDVCPGWDGLPRVADAIAPMLAALAAGRPGHYRRYDWITGEFAETRTVEPTDLLVLDGVGAGHRSWAPLMTTLVWLDAPLEVRRERAFARDGDYFREYWDEWASAEDAYFAAEQPRERADLSFDIPQA